MAERNKLLHQLVSALEQDPRVIACWLGGSLGRANADEWSDIDIEIVVSDADILSIRADPTDFVARFLSPTLVIEAPDNAPSDGAYLLTLIEGSLGPQQVDWYWHAATGASRPINSQLMFERAKIPVITNMVHFEAKEFRKLLAPLIRESLLMALISGKHIRRGNGWSTIRHLEHLAICVRKAQFLEAHGYAPDFEASRSLLPTGTPPVTTVDQVSFVLNELRSLSVLVRVHAPELNVAESTITTWIRTIQDYDTAR